jgi:small subunit ribosomal protein S1
MSTEPQVARVATQPDTTGSCSEQTIDSQDRRPSEALTSSALESPGEQPGSVNTPLEAAVANELGSATPSQTVAAQAIAPVTAQATTPRSTTPRSITPRSITPRSTAPQPATAQTVTGRPAFPDKRELFQPPDRREPVRELPLEARVHVAPARVELPVPTTSVKPLAVAPAAGAAPDQLPVAAEEPAHEAGADATPEEPVANPRESAAEPSITLSQAPGAPIPGIPVESGSVQEAAGAEMEALSYDELMADYGEPAMHAGDLCQGQIISIEGDNVIVHYGGKTEGIVPLAELHQAGIAEPAPGQSIEVSIESLGGPGDYAVLSFLKAHRSRLWEQIESAFHQKELLTAKVTERVKGGLTVDIGIPAFLPGSQADVRPIPDLDALVGQEIPVRIVKLSRGRGNVVVSRRALLEEELQQRRQQTLAGLSEGATVSGTVKSVTNYGAFIDLGGLDGLLHVTDLSWGRVRNPAEVLRVGEEITLKVLKFDPGKERVSLSLKHLQPDPWENIEQRYQEGARVTGRAISITDYGAFVELEPGLEALIHVSELSWSKRLKHPSKLLKLDQQVEGVITQMNRGERRISLSLKRLQPDPWVKLSERYPIGEIVQGRVRNLTTYGAFVEIEEGVDGLVHVSDLSWSSRVKHPKDELKKGQIIRAAVLHVDQENRRVSLGIKQLEPDVWETFFSLHLVGDDVKGQITRFAKFGAFVELAPGVEGLCHNSEMAASLSKQRKPPLRAGEEYEFRIIKLDEFDKKISLSRRAYELAHSTAGTNGTASAARVETAREAVHSFSEESV